jgi:hypothetical protein
LTYQEVSWSNPFITGTVGLDGVDTAFTALGNPDVHAKILIDPHSTAAAPATPQRLP